MKFSIIVPIYNVEKYLAECLESILKQTYTDFEIICINDASTDSSYEVLSKYVKQTSKIKVINNAVNSGLSYSRNKGLEIARGEYVWFIDSDDYIVDNALQTMFETIENKEVDILNFNYGEIIETQVEIDKYNFESQYKEMLIPQTGQTWFCEVSKDKSLVIGAPVKIYKRQFLIDNNLSFYEKILHEDALFLIKALIPARSVINITNCLYVYRRRNDSITKTRDIRRLDSYVVVVNELMALWKNCELEDGMNVALRDYIHNLLVEVRNFMLCFPEHKKLEVGKPEDQFFFELLGNSNISSLQRYVKLNEDELDAIKDYKQRIIFGAGSVATELIQFLQIQSVEFDAIAVSNIADSVKKIGKYKVSQIEDLLAMRKEALVIVAVINRNQKPIYDKLKDLGFENIMLLDTDKV